ncbi:MAG: DUF2141 domain-containing protein [Treponema sp.]|nr:DUF2141 domain-containing protein [Treponema sp.]MCL2238171.1 DUF2141 domain-containing protein [Treponema sp.]
MSRLLFFTLCFSLILFTPFFSEAQTSRVTIEVTNVVVNNGNVIIAIFANAEEFRSEIPSSYAVIPSTAVVLRHEFNLPYGEYAITIFQDANRNNRLDFNILGIPRELLGLSNYNGRGIPARDFNRLKIRFNAPSASVTIGLHRF